MGDAEIWAFLGVWPPKPKKPPKPQSATPRQAFDHVQKYRGITDKAELNRLWAESQERTRNAVQQAKAARRERRRG